MQFQAIPYRLKIDALKSRVNFLTFSLIIVIGAVALGGYYLDTHKNDKFEQIQAIANDVQENKELVINAQRHVDKIFELVEDAKYMDLIDIKDFELSRNNLAWFAFETIAQEIYQEMEYAAEF